jgi:hypothetical protein
VGQLLAESRGREQQLIDYYHNQGIAEDQDNGIVPGSKCRDYYLDAERAKWGESAVIHTRDEVSYRVSS